MHDCLTVGDIMKLICDQLKNDYGDCTTDYKSLLNLALTSKVMLEPALNALWRCQTSLHPLLLTISRFDGSNIRFKVGPNSRQQMARIALVPQLTCLS